MFFHHIMAKVINKLKLTYAQFFAQKANKRRAVIDSAPDLHAANTIRNYTHN